MNKVCLFSQTFVAFALLIHSNSTYYCFYFPNCLAIICNFYSQEWHHNQTCDSAHLQRTRQLRIRTNSGAYSQGSGGILVIAQFADRQAMIKRLLLPVRFPNCQCIAVLLEKILNVYLSYERCSLSIVVAYRD